MPTLKKAAFLAAAIMFIFSPKFGLSQSTATVTDSDSISWVGGTYQITLVPVPPNVTPYRSDTGQNITTSFSGTLDGSGSFSVTLTPISVILPKGLTWQFTVCPNVLAGACGTINIPVQGSGSVSSQINAVITAPRISGGRGSYAYADVEVAAVANNSYYNVTSAALRCYGNSWGACGSGAGGISGLTANYIPKAGSATTITANSAIDDGVTTVGTITSTEPVVAPSFTASGTASGYAGLTAGSSVTAAPTSTVLITVPTSVTAYGLEVPGAQPTTGNTALSCTAANPSVCTWVVPGGPPTGAASNCLTGTYPGPGIAAGCITPAQQQFSITKFGALCAGGDDSTAIQAAINAANSAGGGFVVLPASTCKFATTLTRPRNVIITGQSRAISNLQYTGSTVAIVAGDTGPTNPPFSVGGGFEHLTFIGPSAGGSTIGIYLGGDPNNVISPSATTANNEYWYDFSIQGFGVNVQLGNNAYILNAYDFQDGNGGQLWKDSGTETNSGERMAFVNSIFGQSGSATAPAIELDNNLSDYYFMTTSFDYNNISQPDFGCLASGTMHVWVTSSHFEKNSGEFFHINNSIPCVADIHIFGGTMIVNNATADLIGLAGTGTYQNEISIIGTAVNADAALTQFVDANGGSRQITLDSLTWGYNGDTNLGLGVNAHGNLAGITIRNTIGLASVVGDATTFTTGQFTAGASATTEGAFIANPTLGPVAGVYEAGHSNVFGMAAFCGGYTGFLGFCDGDNSIVLQGITASTGAPLFSIFNSADFTGSFGLGHTSLYVNDRRQVYSYYNTQDDGSGNAITAGNHTMGSLAVGGSQSLASVQGTTGTKIPAATGTFTNGNLRSSNSTGDEVDSGVAISTVARVSNAITSATAGSGISAVTCTTAACTNLRGTYTMTATTVSAGATILTLVWPTTTTAYACLVSQDGGTLAIAPSHSVATATGMAIVSDLAITSGSIGVDYSCQP